MQKTLVALASLLLIACVIHAGEARAEARLLVDVDTGKVLEGENATHPWYPASVTKLMTTYVTFRAVREQRITLDTVFTYGPNAAAQEPSKMGFKVGTQVTVDNALKMMLVHSANDMAVVLAEGVSGSIEKFSSEMNANAQRLGMTQTSYVNPNGLPADEQITSARDLAILARALIREFPEYAGYWHIGAIRFGKRIMSNTNRLLDAYPGADGMKTGFICASGFNIVATATRGDKRLIAVVLGAPSSAARTGRAAQMFERGFASNPLSWLAPSLGNVNALVPIATDPPNLREEICGKHHHRPGVDDDDDSIAASTDDSGGQRSFLLSSLHSPTPKASALLTSGLASPPIDVHVGPPHKPGSPSAAMATIEPAKRKPVAAAVAGKPASAAATAKPPATKPVAHAAVAPSHPTEPASTAAPSLKPWPSDTATAKPAAAKPAAADKPKPTAALQPKPAGAAAKPKPAGTPELKPTNAADAPKPPKPKPAVAAVKPKPVVPPAPSAPPAEAQ
jgi:D-alanyl-D-alanine carboxypeptidase